MKTNPSDTAYPANQVHNDCDGNFMFTSSHSGLTKREYFAALAMQGLMANSDTAYCEMTEVQTADLSVAMADALIFELNKEQD